MKELVTLILNNRISKGAMGNVYLVKRLHNDKEIVINEILINPRSGLDYESSRVLLLKESENPKNSIKELSKCPRSGEPYGYICTSNLTSYTLWCTKSGVHRSFLFYIYSPS